MIANSRMTRWHQERGFDIINRTAKRHNTSHQITFLIQVSTHNNDRNIQEERTPQNTYGRAYILYKNDQNTTTTIIKTKTTIETFTLFFLYLSFSFPSLLTFKSRFLCAGKLNTAALLVCTSLLRYRILLEKKKAFSFRK